MKLYHIQNLFAHLGDEGYDQCVANDEVTLMFWHPSVSPIIREAIEFFSLNRSKDTKLFLVLQHTHRELWQ